MYGQFSTRSYRNKQATHNPNNTGLSSDPLLKVQLLAGEMDTSVKPLKGKKPKDMAGNCQEQSPIPWDKWGSWLPKLIF